MKKKKAKKKQLKRGTASLLILLPIAIGIGYRLATKFAGAKKCKKTQGK